MEDIKTFTLYPKVEIYKGLLPKAKEYSLILKESEKENFGKYYLRKWDKWSIFGTYTQQKHDPNEPREFGKQYDLEFEMSHDIYESYKKAVDHYVKKYNIQIPDGGELMPSSFSKYGEKHGANEELAMNYHNDYVLSEKDMPGPKFFLTCTTYLNDEYEGGDIVFYIEGQKKIYPYKPEAGDILVFPSGPPYYHAVRAITKGEKFFIRNFISYLYDGTKEWLDKQKYYGAYKWGKMESARVEKEGEHSMKYILSDNENNILEVK